MEVVGPDSLGIGGKLGKQITGSMLGMRQARTTLIRCPLKANQPSFLSPPVFAFMHVCAHGGQKRARDPLELKSKMVVSHYEGAENGTQNGALNC